MRVQEMAKTGRAKRVRISRVSRHRLLRFGSCANAIFGLVLVCAGCATYQPQPLNPQRSADRFAARRLDDPHLRKQIIKLTGSAPQPWPPLQWGRAELLSVALAQNPQLAVARAQIDSALAHESAAALSPNPDVELQSEYARREADHWLYGISFDWLLRTPKRRRLQMRIAQLQTGGARANLMQQVWRVRRDVTKALSDWFSAQRQRQLLETLARDHDQLDALQKQRVDAGEDPPSELLVSMRARIETRQQLAELARTSESAHAALARALGVPEPALKEIQLQWKDWGNPPELDLAQLNGRREQALLGRADLAAAIAAYAVSETRLQQAVARQYPQLHLGPGYYWDHGIAKFPFNLGFTLPLNGNRAEIAEARAARKLAAKKMLALQTDIYADVDAAQRQEKVARDSLAIAERDLRASEQLQAQADHGLRLGAINRQQWLVARIDATRARLQVIRMRAQLQVARDSLEDALHTPLSGPELSMAKPFLSTVPGARP